MFAQHHKRIPSESGAQLTRAVERGAIETAKKKKSNTFSLAHCSFLLFLAHLSLDTLEKLARDASYDRCIGAVRVLRRKEAGNVSLPSSPFSFFLSVMEAEPPSQ